MMSSSPSPSRSLHQHGNADGDEDQGPESTEPIETKPAELVEQKDHTESDQDNGANRYARGSLRRYVGNLTFDSSSHGRPGLACGRLGSRSGRGAEKVHVVQTKRVGWLHAHLSCFRSTVSLNRHVKHECSDTDSEDTTDVIRSPDERGENQHVNESLGVFAVI